MEIRPILSTMLRNKTGPLLIAVQIAITLAIVTNAAFIIQQRVEKMNRPTGMDVENLFFAMSVGFGDSYDHMATMREDLSALRAIPGVADAAYMNRIPLSGGGNSTTYYATPDVENGTSQSVNTYNADDKAAEVLGLKLSEGRWFQAEELEYRGQESYLPANVVITKAYADDLFPDESAVGKQIFDSDRKSVV